jgi:hypothetical protein
MFIMGFIIIGFIGIIWLFIIGIAIAFIMMSASYEAFVTAQPHGARDGYFPPLVRTACV